MFSENQHKVGVIGLGIIGSRVAKKLREADCHTYVWNRSPKTEPNFMGSPAEVAQVADIVQIFVRNGDDLVEVVGKMKDQITSRHVIINHATVAPEATRAAAAIVDEAQGSFLDMPFTGSKVAAEKGALVYYAGGDISVLDRVRPVLEISAREILHLGDIGEATILKIVTNMITASTVEVLAEALTLTRANGIDPEKLGEALQHNACGSPLTAMKLPTLIAGDYEPHFSLDNMFKDAQFALDLAKSQNLDLPALSTTANVMFKSTQAGCGDKDFSVIGKRFSASGELNTE
ncbi:MAG: NAD(P)-dependent oxidoreductase [Verrucomicrobia bacterium]|nr:NAD(P)-dependent oxidoreductase [Verrucomicrobiota bacterium]